VNLKILQIAKTFDSYTCSQEPPFLSMTHETNTYTIQDKAERAILYCDVHATCKENEIIQTIISHSHIYSP